MFSTRESSWQSPLPGALASRVKLLRDIESPTRQLRTSLSRGGNQSRGRVRTKLKVMPGLLTAALIEPGALLGRWEVHKVGEWLSGEGRDSGLYSLARE